jgi:hypothetical protein
MLDPSYRSTIYDQNEKIIYDPVHTKSPIDYMKSTIIYLRPLSKSQIGMKQPEYNDLAALTDYELLQAVRVWVGWIENESIPKLKAEVKGKHKLVAKFLGLPTLYQDALDAALLEMPAPVVKITPRLRSKSAPFQKHTPVRKTLPIRTKVVGTPACRVQKVVCIRKPMAIRSRVGVVLRD